MKHSRADSRVKILKFTDVSVPETSLKLHILTRMSAQEYFIEFFRHESFEAYILYNQRVHRILIYQLPTLFKRVLQNSFYKNFTYYPYAIYF